MQQERHWRRGAVLAGLLLGLIGVLASAEPGGQKKKPAPSAVAQDKAEAVIRNIFKAKYAGAAENAGARRELAKILFDEGKKTTDDDDLRFVAIREARDLAARGGDLTLAFQAADELAAGYVVDLPHMKLELLKLAAKLDAGPDEQRALVRRMLLVVAEAVELDQYEVAKTAGQLAESLARKAEAHDLIAEAHKRVKALAQQQAAFEQVRPALKHLQDKPADPAANLTVGKYLCFIKGRWGEGLRHLEKGSDADLRVLAARDAKVADASTPEDDEARAVADAWWDRARTEGPGAAGQIRLRAYRYYKLVLPRLAGLTKARIQERVQEVLEEFPYLASGLLLTLEGHTREVLSVAVTPDGRHALSASWDKTVRIWDLRKGKEVGRLLGHKDEVNAVAVSPDGKLAASAGSENTILVWDMQTRAQLHALTGHTNSVRTLAFAPDSTTLLSGGNDNSLRLWDAVNGQAVHTISNAHKGSTESAVFSADGRYILSGGWDSIVTLWDAKTYKPLRTMKGHEGGVYRVVLTPDGRRAISGSRDRTIRVWDVSNGEEVHKLTGHADDVIGLAVSPDSRRLLSGGGVNDKAMRLWNLESGRELTKFLGHTHGVWSIAYAPNGWRAVTGSADHTVRVWAIPKE